MVCDVDLEMPDATRTHTIEVARGFAAEGLHVDLLTRGADPNLAGVCHHRARGAEDRRAFRIFDLNALALTILLRRRHSAARCYVRHRWSNIPIIIAARLLGYRVVTQVDDIAYGRHHEPDIPLVVDYVKRMTAILMGRLSNGIVAVTPQIKTLLVEEFHAPADRIAALPNGVDVDFFHPLPRTEAITRAGLEPACRYTVFCGHFQPWVDFDTLLEAFSIVADASPNARLILLGDGSERERVEAEIRRLKLGTVVDITGFLRDRAAVRDLLAAATVTVAAHRSEYVSHFGVSPTKLAEYLAVGRAVVVQDVPGLREVVAENRVGIVVPADPKAVSQAIVSLLEDPQQADELGANGRRLAEQVYSWRAIVRRTIPLFGI